MDVIDSVLGDAGLAALRQQRAEIRRLSQDSHDAVIAPADASALSHAERAALACRIARRSGARELLAHYAALLAARDAGPALAALAEGRDVPEGGRLGAMAAYVDRLAATPRESGRAELEALRQAGLDTAAIVALSELAAFLSYQIRLVAGLRLLGRAA